MSFRFIVTLRIFISFPRRLCDLERFFLVIDLMATGELEFCFFKKVLPKGRVIAVINSTRGVMTSVLAEIFGETSISM